MKKVLLIVVSLLLVFATMAGCSSAAPAASSSAPAASSSAPAASSSAPAASSEAPAASSSAPAASSSAPAANLIMGLSMPEIKTDGFTAMANGVKNYAKDAGVDLRVVDADNDAQKQMAQVEDFISQKVAAIIMCPADSGALSEAVKKANEAKIPVVCMDRSVTSGVVTALIESDNVEHGYQAGLYMAAAAEKANIALKDLKILELQGDLATSAGKERSEGFQKACKEKGMTIVTSLPTYWDPDKSYNAALDAFQAHPDINAIFEASDSIMCAAVNSALDQLKKAFKVGDPKHIIVTTVDGCPVVIDAIKAGQVDATAVQSILTFGSEAIKFAKQAATGEIKVDANVTQRLAPIKASIDNVDSMDLWANAIKK